MRVLLTGANGFVGSHILEALLRAGHEVAILCRPTSDLSLIAERLGSVRVCTGALDQPGSLAEAVRGAEVVIHCAAKTKALSRAEFHAVNVAGTCNLLEACNAAAPGLRQFILISSLAVSGPGTPEEPAQEEAPPRPCTDYGRSKLLAELCVRRRCRAPFTILRPAAVYGPGDRDFLLAFRAGRSGLVPLIDGGRQPLSLIYAPDAAQGVVKAVGRERAFGGTYHLAHGAPVAQREFLLAAARAAGAKRPAAVFVPSAALYPVCAAQELVSRLTGRPSILNLQKVPEYLAPGWVCSTERAVRDLDFVAWTPIAEGVRLTAAWYRQRGWL